MVAMDSSKATRETGGDFVRVYGNFHIGVLVS